MGHVQTEEDLFGKPTVKRIEGLFQDCADFERRDYEPSGISVFYLVCIVGNDSLMRDIVLPFSDAGKEEALAILRRPPYRLAENARDCMNGILEGCAAILLNDQAWLIDLSEQLGRNIEQSETETVIAGPHDGFVENIFMNIAVMRKRIRSPRLKTLLLSVGEISRTPLMILYIDGLVNPDNLNRLVQRIENIEIDAVFETNMLVQFIDENPNSVFPQFMTTERPDAAASKLLGGKIIGILEGSPSVFSCPTAFFDFFTSPDDYYQRWLLGSALRLLRIIGFLITIGFTAFYVSVTTFHYEMIPHTMLLNLTESRSKVPFPPLFEALLMETTIELLREAGARLPTKIGQTIGIVGGIVIGQAAVQAGFTSNILIIAVATSAIASFVIPSYVMSASLRLIRFGLIILAGMYGNLGLLMGIGLIIIQLSGITNLGASYLTPIAPASFKDMLDTFVRGPFWALTKRPTISRSPNKTRQKMRK
ncbi:spore germination protein [Cohnella sp. AR92]|uniref:spore germination protein n=1 Tax=Cohnella sp. AR92 TaxID=648716 RepID=UPI000F8E530D|nr:spore germination protein [Cohnella sp. AR92]RUS44625.1 spore germination protein [Cohnella sp. AR92]